jgi:PAS domain S-box-containing protein
MAASSQGFRSLIEHNVDAISVIDSQGEILYGSASTSGVFGYQPEELVGRNYLELIHPEDRDHSRLALKEVLAKPPGPLHWDARILNKDGNYYWIDNTVSNLLLEAEVQAIVVHQRNIDARKAAEEARKQHAEELTRCNERLEEFAYIAAHDLREPLRAISAYTEMLVQETQMDANTRQMAKFIVDGTARMSTLIDDLLSFASTGMREPPQSIDLENALEQARQNLVLEIKESGASITVDSLPVVRGNEIQLVRLLQNLIGNAVKYRGKESLKIHVSSERDDSEWVIRIADNGIGIAQENQARVFMPFIRLANPGIPGTGLGLAVCKNIVEGLGGAIWVTSEPGAGSTFSFTIVAKEKKKPIPSADAPADGGPARSRRSPEHAEQKGPGAYRRIG